MKAHSTSCFAPIVLEVEEKRLKMKYKNEYDLSQDYGIGYTKSGFRFLFDKEDFEKIKKYYWYPAHGYIASVGDDYKAKRIYMHRFIVDCPDDMVVDHINHDISDNRKCNLRICLKAENNRNVTITSQNSSGVRGVNLNNKKNRWVARITYQGKIINLGSFIHKEDAIKARKEAEILYFGEFAYKEKTV